MPDAHYAYTRTDSPVCGGYASEDTTTDPAAVTCGDCIAWNDYAGCWSVPAAAPAAPVCSWCEVTATRNLDTPTEQACEAHYARYAAPDAAWGALDRPTHQSRFWTVPVNRYPLTRRLAAAAVMAAGLAVASPAVAADGGTLPPCASDEGPDGQPNRGCAYDARHMGNGIGRSFVIRRDKDGLYGTLTYVTHARAHFLLTGVQL